MRILAVTHVYRKAIDFSWVIQQMLHYVSGGVMPYDGVQLYIRNNAS